MVDPILIVIGCIVVACGWFYHKLRKRLDELNRHKTQLFWQAKELDAKEQKLAAQAEAVHTLAKQKSIGFPWLAEAYADYFELEALKEAVYLKRKAWRAIKAAEKVNEHVSKRRTAEREARILRYQLSFYEHLFPWLADLKDEEIEDVLIQVKADSQETQDDDDAAKIWLSCGEYESLSTTEKYQRALDNYWRSRKKTKWQIGRDYERYIGYLYACQGYSVTYQGILQGFDDLGRDLICKNANATEIVQCKYWSASKTINEKHIFQLFGTLIAYELEHDVQRPRGVFVTSTALSERARDFAHLLSIDVVERKPLESYPCIKCNVSKRDGRKIYHLPFDQQYDKTFIEPERGEFFASTVSEAEAKGFRRAMRYSE